jgi:integrase
MKLTEQIIAGITLRRGERERLIADDAMTGLRLRLRQGAKGVTKTWVFKYSQGGQQRSFTLDHAATSLAAARKWAGELQAKLRLGQDPAADRSAGRGRAQETFGAVLPAYLANKRLALKPRSYGEVERHLLVHCKPLHGHSLRAIAPAMVATRYAAITANSGATTANNVWRSLHAFLTWGMQQGYLDRNPAVGVQRRRDRKRDRVLTASELKALWQATEGDGDYNAIVRLLLLTGCRMSEIGSLRWDEIYSDRIVLAGERVKNGRNHAVALLPAMLAILDAQPRRGDFVFGRSADHGFTGWSVSKQGLDRRLGDQVARWTLHDLRRSFATGLGDLNVPPHVIEGCLNHRTFKGGIIAHYNLAQLEMPMRHAWATWETHVLAIAEGRVAGDRVVPLRLNEGRGVVA